MKPGRELDTLVAEKVMGWRLEERGYGATFWVDESGKVKRAAEPCSIDFCSCEVFSPSTDISDAWKVVEKLRKRFVFFIGDSINEDNEKIYRVIFRKENSITLLFNTYEAFAETAPLAICLAALKAVGVDVE